MVSPLASRRDSVPKHIGGYRLTARKNTMFHFTIDSFDEDDEFEDLDFSEIIDSLIDYSIDCRFLNRSLKFFQSLSEEDLATQIAALGITPEEIDTEHYSKGSIKQLLAQLNDYFKQIREAANIAVERIDKLVI